MSFLAGRLAAAEGSFFLQESKLAASRLAEKLTPSSSGGAGSNSSAAVSGADVLPEILRHSIPLKSSSAASADPTLSTTSKWLIKGHATSPTSAMSSDSSNPLRAFVSLPRTTFGPKRWELPNEQPTFSASTANDLRRDRYPSINPEKLKALEKGYSQIGKAFAIATMIVFGGATALFVYTAHKLQIENPDQIRSRGKNLMQPHVDMIREQLVPLRSWVEHKSKKWHVEGKGKVEEKPIIKGNSKVFIANSSN